MHTIAVWRNGCKRPVLRAEHASPGLEPWDPSSEVGVEESVPAKTRGGMAWNTPRRACQKHFLPGRL